MIYFLIFFALVACVTKYDAFNFKKRQQIFNAFVCVLIVICGIRYRVGTDTIAYMDEYNGALHDLSDRYQIGWILILKFFKSINANFYFVQFAIATIINWGVCRFINSSKKMYIFSGLLLYYSLLFPAWNFEILRQSICISLFLIALPYIKKKLSIYFILICIASTIHEMSLILLFVPLFMKIQLNKLMLLCFTSLICLIIAIAPFLREQFIQLAISISFLEERATYYYSEVDDAATFSFMSYFFNVLLNIAIPLCFIFMDKNNKHNGNDYYILCILSIFTYALSMMIPMLYRVNYYFSLFTLLLFIDIIFTIVCKISSKRNTRQLLYALILFSLILVKGRIYISKNYYGIPMYTHYYPYTNIFNEYKVHDREKLLFY